jgi:gamma-tubulin complex component 2
VLSPGDSRVRGSEAQAFPGHTGASLTDHMPRYLGNFSGPVQNNIILRELLLAMAGVDGVYITVAAPNSSDSSVATTRQDVHSQSLKNLHLLVDDENIERSIAGQVSQLLPTCEQLIQIREFIRRQSRYEYGLVSQAVAAAIKLLLREFDVVLSQLELLLDDNKLSLQKLSFLTQSSRTVIRLLANLCKRVDGCAGGNLLEKLHSCLLEIGDTKGRDLYAKLLNKAAEPFLEMLERWIFRGELVDPYKEFMIAENVSYSKEALTEDFTSQYWEAHFTLRNEHIPQLLQPFAQKSLTTGKYLTVIRGCNGHRQGPLLPTNYEPFSAAKKIEDASNSANGEFSQYKLESDCSTKIPKAIDDAYRYSSQALLRLLEDKYALSEHLQSLRRFFLLENGDFFIQFMDIAEDELRKDVKEVNTQRIQSLLQLAISSSTLANDVHREDVSCSIKTQSLIQHLQQLHRASVNNCNHVY